MTSPRRVEVVLDFACVHCYIGFTRYAQAISRYRAQGGAVDTVFRPFQLQPEASPAGEPLVDVWARERGASVAAKLAADTSFGAADALTLDFRRAVFTNTFDAHRLVAQAAVQGTGEEMVERLFRAYFADGLNIADPGTLARLAVETGVTDTGDGVDELRAELARVRALALPTLPVFRFVGGTTLSGEVGGDDVLAALHG